MVFKFCVVPSCNTTNENHPEKLFLTVPKNPVRRESWARAIKVSHIPFNGKYCVCEDHFNVSFCNIEIIKLSEDSINWLYYCTMGTANLLLKPNVVPHKFINNPSNSTLESQVHEARKRSLGAVYDEAASISKKIKNWRGK
ncbi:hypothetical protein NQ315_014242 [Exocentrus adspersus]|uniref:THAP-type domain-containing protein n=1 Tax=Exocentrus adspersus TaxID=1586481 RepID=A0AAV8VCR5_9CUCU|nr:hypothetical protein NQ315_014242 [Exocentrus adspersus]